MYMEKITLIFLVFMLSAAGGTKINSFFWDDGGADHLWSTAENWDSNEVPDSNDKATFEPISGEGAIIDSNMTGAKKARAYYVVLGHNKAGTAESLTINGGELDVYSRFYFGDKDNVACTGKLYMNSGTINFVGSAEKFYVGYKPQATGYVYMTGGTINTPRMYLGGEYASSTGYIYMKGGTINVGDRMFIGGHGAGYLYMTGGTINTYMLSIAENNSATTHGEVHLDGGTIIVGSGGFSMRSMSEECPGSLDICEGTLIINGNIVSTIEYYISKGWITAYSIKKPEAVKVVYEDGKTMVTAAKHMRATKPNPADGATNVPRKVVLCWTPGADVQDVNEHHVYFGTDEKAVADANTTVDPCSVYKGPCDVNKYAPSGLLDMGRTYYWRIDEVGDSCIWKGRIWSFTVVSVTAGNPNPKD